MSSLGDAFKALRKVILIEENVSRMQTDIANMAGEIGRVRDYAGGIDRRVARLEGIIEGASMARGMKPRVPKLPKE